MILQRKHNKTTISSSDGWVTILEFEMKDQLPLELRVITEIPEGAAKTTPIDISIEARDSNRDVQTGFLSVADERGLQQTDNSSPDKPEPFFYYSKRIYGEYYRIRTRVCKNKTGESEVLSHFKSVGDFD